MSRGPRRRLGVLVWLPAGWRVGEAGTVAVTALAWLVAVFVWPRLPDGGAGGADRQSSVLIAVAGIMAGLVVLTLTVGSIALQVLSQFSWRVTRTVLGKRLAAGLMVAAGGGVVAPLWVAIGPPAGRTRMVAAAAGWSALILMFTAWTAARRINPVALAERACERAWPLITVRRPGRVSDRVRLASAAEALAELVTGSGAAVRVVPDGGPDVRHRARGPQPGRGRAGRAGGGGAGSCRYRARGNRKLAGRNDRPRPGRARDRSGARPCRPRGCAGRGCWASRSTHGVRAASARRTRRWTRSPMSSTRGSGRCCPLCGFR